MLCNLKEFIKINKCANSCKTYEQLEVVIKWAEKIYNEIRLTKFEYIAILDTIKEKQDELKEGFPRTAILHNWENKPISIQIR